MTVQPIAWSHSRVKTYLDCPKMFWHQNILKDVKYEQGEQQAEGTRVHKALEVRLSNGVALPPQYAKWERVILAIKSMPGTTYGERDFCLNHQLKPTGYFEKDAWVRVTVDVINLQLNRRWGWLGDYKNGKINFDEDQLMLYAAVGFIFFPDIDTFEAAYIWLQHGVVDSRTYKREDAPALWRHLLQVPAAIQRAGLDNHWPAKPSRKCGYCSVNKAGKCSEASERYRGT